MNYSQCINILELINQQLVYENRKLKLLCVGSFSFSQYKKEGDYKDIDLLSDLSFSDLKTFKAAPDKFINNDLFQNLSYQTPELVSYIDENRVKLLSFSNLELYAPSIEGNLMLILFFLKDSRKLNMSRQFEIEAKIKNYLAKLPAHEKELDSAAEKLVEFKVLDDKAKWLKNIKSI